MSWKVKKPKSVKRDIRNLAANEVLFREGDVGDKAYLLKSGSIAILKFDGQEFQELAVLEPPILFGEMALLDKQPRSATARAVGDAELEVMDQRQFVGYLKTEPGAAFRIMQQLSANLRKTNEKYNLDIVDDARSINSSNKLEFGDNDTVDDIDSILSKYTDILGFYNARALSRTTLSIVSISMALLLLMTVWLTFSTVDTTLSLTGKIITASPNIQVQSNFNSVVNKVFVQKGAVVRKGDPLIQFDDTILAADGRKLDLEATFLEQATERLAEEVLIPLGKGMPTRISDEVQRQIFINRRAEFLSRLKAFSANEEGLRGQVLIQSELEEGREKLYKQNLLPKVELLSTQGKRLDVQRELATILADKDAFVSEWIATINEQFLNSQKLLLDAKEELGKVNRQLSDVITRAPVGGLVLDIENMFPGAVVTQGGKIMTIVPTGDTLRTEFDVSAVDAGLLTQGAAVSISLDALPYQKHGQTKGKLIYISADTVGEGSNTIDQGMFKAMSTFDITQLSKVPSSFTATPGMSVVGRVKVGERRLITYLLYPVVKTLDQSFTEP